MENAMTDYRAIARTKSNTEITFALADIQETLALYRDASLVHPYVARLYSEFDALLDEKRHRARYGHRPRHRCYTGGDRRVRS
jgi:hypothetical protein